MSDPFAPSTDPDIPTPSRNDLLPLVYGAERDHLIAGSLDARHAENLWRGARRDWDEGHKRDAKRRRAEEQSKHQQESDKPLEASLPEPPKGKGMELSELNKLFEGEESAERGESPSLEDTLNNIADSLPKHDLEEQRRGIERLLEPSRMPEIERPQTPEIYDHVSPLLDDIHRREDLKLRRREIELREQDIKARQESHKGIVAWVKRNPYWAAFIAFVVWQLPLGIAQLWPVFVRDKTIPEWVAESRWPGMTPHVFGWLSVIFFVTLIILATIVTLYRKSEKVRTASPYETRRLILG